MNNRNKNRTTSPIAAISSGLWTSTADIDTQDEMTRLHQRLEEAYDALINEAREGTATLYEVDPQREGENER